MADGMTENPENDCGPHIRNARDMASENEDAEKKESDFGEWKNRLENNFHSWVNGLTDIPEVEEVSVQPDIYSFYEELAVFKNEIRKGGRRTHEVLSRFGDSLSNFQELINSLNVNFAEINRDKATRGKSSGQHLLLPLVDILVRMERLEERFQSPPPRSFFNSSSNWETAWNSLKKGYEIIFSYTQELVKGEGILKILTENQPFDPTGMTAVAVEQTDEYPPDSVIQEITPGFQHNGVVIKLAEVKVSKAINS